MTRPTRPPRLDPASWSRVRAWLSQDDRPWFAAGTGLIVGEIEPERALAAMQILFGRAQTYDLGVRFDATVPRELVLREKGLREVVELTLDGTALGLQGTVSIAHATLQLDLQMDLQPTNSRPHLFLEFGSWRSAVVRADLFDDPLPPRPRVLLERVLEVCFAVARAGRAKEVVVTMDLGDPYRECVRWTLPDQPAAAAGRTSA
jgi:hypothetical protein